MSIVVRTVFKGMHHRKAPVSPVSVLARPFGVTDDDRVERRGGGFELEAELLLHGRQEARESGVYRRARRHLLIPGWSTSGA
jgi:hypothetical protein